MRHTAAFAFAALVSMLPEAAWSAEWVSSRSLTGSGVRSYHYFAFGLDLSGDTLVAGAHGDSTRGSAAGAAYVFTRSADQWSEQAKLVPEDLSGGDAFAQAIAVDGDTLVAGAMTSEQVTRGGAAYVYVRSGSGWALQQKVLPSAPCYSCDFGSWVDVDGDTMVVGEPMGPGAAYVYTRTGGTWTLQQKLTDNAGSQFGFPVILDGDTLVVGANRTFVGGLPGVGTVYVYRRTGSAWSLEQTLTASDGQTGDQFGWSASLSGDTLAVGAFEAEGSKGAVYVFERTEAGWNETQRLLASDGTSTDVFGLSVALENDLLLVGSRRDNRPGTAYLFQRGETGWQQVQMLAAPNAETNDGFGWATTIEAGTIVVSGPYHDASGTDSGAAYVFGLTCSEAADCAPGEYCSASGCALLRGIGEACDSDETCAAGFCVDGVCCEGACTDQCTACDVAGAVGTCTLVTGAPHGDRDPCLGTGQCTGRCDGEDPNACTYAGEETSCAQGYCDGAAAVSGATCDGAGACQERTTAECGEYACRSGECLTGCEHDVDCAVGLVCSAGSCGAVGPKTDGGTEQQADGGVGGDPAGERGCGCAATSGTGGAAWLVLLLVPWLRRRVVGRRERCRRRAGPPAPPRAAR